MILRLLTISFIILLLAGCSGRHSDPRLDRAAVAIERSPLDALDSLAAINPDALSDPDRHYLDFLTIKAHDKAYILHESDSLILDAINYYSSHEKALYPEALYYAGRVYSDLGDYPTALKYFHDALDHLPDDAENLDLRTRILSQTGRLLNSLSLYTEAIPYIEEALTIKRQFNDTVRIVYDLQLLANTYLRARNHKLSEKYYKEALSLGKNLPYNHTAKTKIYIAANKLYINEIDSALYYIKNTIDYVEPTVRNNGLLYASKIYLNAGLLDTAYMYAHELMISDDPLNKDFAYEIILSPELKQYSTQNEREKYLTEYRYLLASYYDSNQMQLAINQQNFYNYQLHVREKEKAEKSRDTFRSGFSIILLFTIILIFTLLYLKNRDQNRIIELHEALDNIKELNAKLNHSIQKESIDKAKETIEKKETTPKSLESKEHVLREQIRKELLTLYDNADKDKGVSETILQSNAYKDLQELIHGKTQLKDDNPLWNELENIILESSPNFYKHISLLSMGNLTLTELRTAMLIKCGIKPTQIAILMGRSPAAIGSRRETLSQKIFDRKLGPKVIDTIIRLL